MEPKPLNIATGDRLSFQGSSSRNVMTVDVEDYFQVSAFASSIDRRDWEGMTSRIERNMDRVFEIFSDGGAHATFFTLGWVAERYPKIVRRIVEQGHELASHGYAHYRVTDQDPETFRADVRRTKILLEDIGGVAVNGYRAASFSIVEQSLWAHEILSEEGYRYSSSVYPVRHDHYGMPSAPRFAYRPVESAPLVEIPVSTVRMFDHNFPCGGGGYFRLAPYRLSQWAMRRVNRHDRMPCIFYFHPWEVDPDQPRPQGLGAKARLRHYLNLRRMEPRLRRLLDNFSWDRMDQVFLADGSDQK